MFRENENHLQFGLFDTLQRLPEKVRQRLEASWADIFHPEVFCRIDESPFAVLYSDQPSLPNTPINILVAAEILKSGFGWSDEELYDEIQFNLQVRYALGLRDMGEVPFELRTLYNFRQRLSQHMPQPAHARNGGQSAGPYLCPSDRRATGDPATEDRAPAHGLGAGLEQQLARQKSQEVLSLLSRGWLRLRSWFHVQPVRRSLNFVLVPAKT